VTLFLVSALVLTAICVAQEYRGSINGRIVDPQQKVVPGVTIAVTDTNTGSKQETVSSGDGQYTLPFLLPGTYRVEAQLTGFKRYLREGIRVSTNASPSILRSNWVDRMRR
jgi:hypothetical protein